MSQAPEAVSRLVERFARNAETYKNPTYNETQVRREFIDPFFKALGWDVDNEQGYAEAYKDVIHEDAIKVGGVTKAPDYCFRIGGTRKFFLEAKKPAIPLKDHAESAFQLRRYAWSAKLPLSILTDFEELAVYDCRIRPRQTDKSSTGRTMYFTYDEYEDRWDELASIFSRDAVLKGSFDKYAESKAKKRGTTEVDAEFLREIERWRELLARNFALRNPRLSVRDLNFAVQRTIDRIIFLRMCEDRNVEPYGELQALRNGIKVYARLGELFRRADDRYNSSLFYFTPEKGREPPDELTLALKLDDQVLKDIIGDLYYPDSPYEFSVLPPEILGQVYEQFLGKVIRLTKGHHAKVEEKPEVKKAGGVYYTPTYIVDYIVKNTVGKLLEGKTPKQVGPDPPKRSRRQTEPRPAGSGTRGKTHPLRILDPACGSGSFLLGAYRHLLDWHRDYYTTHDPESWARRKNPPIYQVAASQPLTPDTQSPTPAWRLTVQEKKRILLNNIYGVDIDSQAVEVTKLSLLLKVLEGETAETIGQTLRLFHERALPDLSQNIKCGNSLIGPDFYENQQMSLLDDEERYRINVFDWQAEFPEVFARKNPGFDAVIGNPPYVRGRSLDVVIKRYLALVYNTFTPNSDIYVGFLERALLILNENGFIGFIVPRPYLTEAYAETSRRNFLSNAEIAEIVDFKHLKVFDKATVQSAILIVRNARPREHTIRITKWPSREMSELPSNIPLSLPDASLRTDLTQEELALIRKVQRDSFCVGDVCYVSYSVAAHSEIENKKKDAYIFDHRVTDKCVRFIEAREISRYQIAYRGRWLHYDPSIVRRPGLPDLFAAEKLMIRDVVGERGLLVAYDDTGLYADYSVICMTLKTKLKNVTTRKLHFNPEKLRLAEEYSLLYVLGILNSCLLNFVFRKVVGGGLHVYPNNIRQLPIRCVNFAAPAENARHKRIIELVQQMLDLHKRLAAAKTPDEKTRLQRQIDATDRQIDQLVYELYNLTDEEIKIVEGTTE